MADNHGNTPAAWTGVLVSLLGFVVGGAAASLSPINWPLFWVGIVLAVAGLPVFIIMGKLGYHESNH